MSMETTDYDALYEAKRELIRMIWGDPDSPLWHLVHLVDSVHDKAISDGLWRMPSDVEGIVRKADLLQTEPIDGEMCWDLRRGVGMERKNGEWVDVSYDYWRKNHVKGEM